MVKCPNAAQHYLTIVYRITEPKQPRALLEQAEWSAASHTHAIQERDRLIAALNDIQAQHREAFRKIERLHDEIGRVSEQRDVLLAALKLLEEAYCANDYGTREGRVKGRAALIAARLAIANATQEAS